MQRLVFFIIALYTCSFATESFGVPLVQALEKAHPAFHALSDRLQETKSKHQVYVMLNARLDLIDSRFPVTETDCASIVTDLSIPRTNTQSAKDAIGGLLFWENALDPAHQTLIYQCFLPLYNSLSQWDAGCDQVIQNIQSIVAEHPYFRNRYTLFALAVAGRFGNELAQLVLAAGAKHLSEYSAQAVQKLVQPAISSLRNPQRWPIFQQLLCSRNLILNLYPLSMETDPIRYWQRMAALGLPHFFVLLGQHAQRQNDLSLAIQYYESASNAEDFEGHEHIAALLQKHPSLATPLPYIRHIVLAFWKGSQNSKIYAALPYTMQEQYAQEYNLLVQLKRFLSGKSVL